MSTKVREWIRLPHTLLPTDNITGGWAKLGARAALTGLEGTTLLRTRAQLIIGADVGDPAITSPPPERWWHHLMPIFGCNVSDVSSTDYADPTSDDVRIVNTNVATPTTFTSPTAPAEYYVTWSFPGGMSDSAGQRKWDGTTGAGFWLLPSIKFLDGDDAISSGIYPGVNIYAYLYLESLWEFVV